MSLEKDPFCQKLIGQNSLTLRIEKNTFFCDVQTETNNEINA